MNSVHVRVMISEHKSSCLYHAAALSSSSAIVTSCGGGSATAAASAAAASSLFFDYPPIAQCTNGTLPSTVPPLSPNGTAPAPEGPAPGPSQGIPHLHNMVCCYLTCTIDGGLLIEAIHQCAIAYISACMLYWRCTLLEAGHASFLASLHA